MILQKGKSTGTLLNKLSSSSKSISYVVLTFSISGLINNIFYVYVSSYDYSILESYLYY
jgi:hypothetical protein